MTISPQHPGPGSSLLALARRRDGAVLAGVCTALSQRFGVDVLLVRVAVVLLALGGGIGVVGYAWAWLALPPRPGARPLLVRWFPQTAGWGTQQHLRVVGLLAIATALLASAVLPWSVGPAVVLAALVLLGRRSAAGGSGPAGPAAQAPAGTTADFAAALAAWQHRLAQVEASAAPSPTLPAPLPAEPPAPARARRRGSWPAGLVWLGLAAGAGCLAGTLDVARPVLLGQAVALAVLAVALLGSWLVRSRRPRLVVLAGLLLGASIASGAWQQPGLTGREASIRVVSAAELPAGTQQLNGSEVSYDLTGLELDDDATLAVRATASHVTIRLPRAVNYQVHYRLLGSNLELDEGGRTALATSGVTTAQWPEPQAAGTTPSGPRLTLELDLRGSAVEVQHG